MQRFSLLAVAVFTTLSLGIGPASARVEVGDFPRYSLVTTDGKTVNPAVMRGRITILEFWATWCPPCRAQIPHLKKLHRESRGTNVVLISVSIDDRERTATRFAEDNAMVWPQVHDRSQRNPIQGQFDVRGIPHAFIISPEGKVLWRGHPAHIDAPLKKAMRAFPTKKRNADEKQRAASTEQHNAEPSEAGKNRPKFRKAVSALIAAMREDNREKREQVLDAATATFADFPLDLLHAYPRDETLLELAGTLKTMSSQDRFELGASAKRSRSMDQVTTVLRVARAAEIAHRESAGDPKGGGAAGNASDASGKAGPDPRLVEIKTRAAERAIDRDDLLKAYETFQWLAERGHGPSAERVAAYEADEQAMNAIAQAMKDRQAERWLDQARMFASAGHREKAIELLDQIVETHRQSSFAELAEVELAQLR